MALYSKSSGKFRMINFGISSELYADENCVYKVGEIHIVRPDVSSRAHHVNVYPYVGLDNEPETEGMDYSRSESIILHGYTLSNIRDIWAFLLEYAEDVLKTQSPDWRPGESIPEDYYAK